MIADLMASERQLALNQLSEDENLDSIKLEKIIGEYLFTEKTPMRDDVIGMLKHYRLEFCEGSSIG